MVDGESLDDETIIDIFVYELRTLPDDSSFILDGFPTTLEQATVRGIKLLDTNEYTHIQQHGLLILYAQLLTVIYCVSDKINSLFDFTAFSNSTGWCASSYNNHF